MLTIEPSTAPGTVRPQGEIDMATAAMFSEALEEAASSGEQLVVDMAGVTFIDSSGLHVLMKAAVSLNGRAPLVLSNVPPPLGRLLTIVGMDALPSIEVRAEEGSR